MNGMNMTFISHFVTYWAMIGYYGDTNKKGYWDVCRASFKNQIFILYPSLWVLFKMYPFVEDNILGSLCWIPFHILMVDVWFYLSHRLAHTKWLWKYHKMHHKYPIHIATALDGGFLEHFFVNQLSVAMGPLLIAYMGYTMNVYIFSWWVAFTTWNNCLAHLENSVHHHHHHTYLKCNYGNGLYVMDRLFGSFQN